MNRSDSADKTKLPKGVALLPKARWGRPYRASIRTGKGASVHLGLYDNPWHAAFAYDHAADLLKRSHPPLRIPSEQQPTADEVHAIRERVQGRLGLVRPDKRALETPPTTEAILTMFEVIVVPFWRSEASKDEGDRPGSGIDASARRLAETARILFWSRAAGLPNPLEAMTRLLSRRLELTFRSSDLTREVLDDEGDDELGVARWLVYPEDAEGSLRSFRDEIHILYADVLQDPEAGLPDWAIKLGLDLPLTSERVRAAFLNRSRTAHPDAGGTDAAFVKLRMAYEEGLDHCRLRGC